MTERYDAKSALEELKEDALLPHPVRLRDMILRIRLGATMRSRSTANFRITWRLSVKRRRSRTKSWKSWRPGNPKIPDG